MDREIIHQVIIGAVCSLLVVDCGFHEGWATVTLPLFAKGDDPITLTSDQEVLIINLLYVGVGIGALAPIFLMDKIGRKWTLIFAALPKIFSWIAISFANSNITLCGARLLAGVGCGITYSVMPMYIGEISSKRTRGPLGTLITVLINVGLLIIYVIGLRVDRFTMGMISLGIPVLFVVTFIWLPESSVYLTRKNRLTHAKQTLMWSLGKDDVEKELEEIRRIVFTEDQVRHIGLLGSMKVAVKTEACKKAIIIMFILGNVLTLTGAAPILAYQSFIFDKAGFDIGADVGIVVTGCAIVIAGIVCVLFVKIIGKRKLIVFAAPLTTISLGLVAIFFTLMAYGVNVESINWIPTVFIVIYVILYGLALNPMPLAYLGEIFPFDVKVPAGICASIYYALSTTATVKVFQVLNDSYGTHVPFWLFTGITFVLSIFIYIYVIETEGLTLEEIQHALSKPSITQKSANRIEINPVNRIVITSFSTNSTTN
ncbi:hypothetical protein PV325_000704 [Microctonus aethiopoides]|uniref:Major facilitator superfamily (MFS) profile domain-containing protein n=1 Tax=Microctonus aethiopoides TaxID=144406 RepID=A0AA39FY81_9HYME|nr:hypothetical protein PV325_000704 [Microctonus aethiopoides]KAK0178042.1 hypothetical protein PV328_002027 [Microctonus aethiopoides]